MKPRLFRKDGRWACALHGVLGFGSTMPQAWQAWQDNYALEAWFYQVSAHRG